MRKIYEATIKDIKYTLEQTEPFEVTYRRELERELKECEEKLNNLEK